MYVKKLRTQRQRSAQAALLLHSRGGSKRASSPRARSSRVTGRVVAAQRGDLARAGRCPQAPTMCAFRARRADCHAQRGVGVRGKHTSHDTSGSTQLGLRSAASCIRRDWDRWEPTTNTSLVDNTEGCSWVLDIGSSAVLFQSSGMSDLSLITAHRSPRTVRGSGVQGSVSSLKIGFGNLRLRGSGVGNSIAQ